MAYGISVPQAGIKARPQAVKASNPNYWIAREFPLQKTLSEHLLCASTVSPHETAPQQSVSKSIIPCFST